MRQTKHGTADLILDVAERLFAEQGYKAVSIRSILRECGANIAAAHYHFGSKQELLEAIFERHSAGMNATRLELLAAAKTSPGCPDAVERILDAFLRPALVWREDSSGTRRFMRLRAVVANEQEDLARGLISRYFNDTSRHFVEALKAELPQLGMPELYFRFHFLLGGHYYTVLNPGRIYDLSNGLCNPADSEQTLQAMICFFAAGLRAPSSIAGPAASKQFMETAT